MDESNFKLAVAAVSSGSYDEADVKAIKEQLDSLNQKELSIRRQMEKSKNEFVKKKDKSYSELKVVRGDIRKLRNILKNI